MESQTHEWAQFFDKHAPKYLDNIFTKNTAAEVDFLLTILPLEAGSSILDIGCGAGRHSIEFARRGYRMTGVDISSGMLAEAAKGAASAGVDVTWIQADATRFKADGQFDGGICLCEGAFSLLGMTDDPIEHDLAILTNIHSALVPGGIFVLTALNGLRKIREFSQDDVARGVFDPLTTTDVMAMREDDVEVRVRERGYVPSELNLLFRLTGFETLHIWGGTAGAWGRRQVELDEIELMIVGRRI